MLDESKRGNHVTQGPGPIALSTILNTDPGHEIHPQCLLELNCSQVDVLTAKIEAFNNFHRITSINGKFSL